MISTQAGSAAATAITNDISPVAPIAKKPFRVTRNLSTETRALFDSIVKNSSFRPATPTPHRCEDDLFGKNIVQAVADGRKAFRSKRAPVLPLDENVV